MRSRSQHGRCRWSPGIASSARPTMPTPPTAARAGRRTGGASNAAGFLSRFVPDEGRGWLHVDLAACFSENGDSLWAPRANTLGMRTIAHTLMAEAR